MSIVLEDTPDWMLRMVNRTLQQYYGSGLDVPIGCRRDKRLAALLRGARYSARRKHRVWLQALNDLTSLLSDCTLEDMSPNTYWYSYQADVIPFKVTSSDSRGMTDAALSNRSNFIGLTIAASTLCPLFHAQPYLAWRRRDGINDCRWVYSDEEQAQAANVWIPFADQIDLVMNSYGYRQISSELLFAELPRVDSSDVTIHYVKDYIFGEFTFGELRKPFDISHRYPD